MSARRASMRRWLSATRPSAAAATVRPVNSASAIATAVLPHHANESGILNPHIPRYERQIEVSRRRADERIERIGVRAHLVREIDLLRRQVDRLIGGIAEQVAE